MLVEGVHAGPLYSVAGDAGVIHADTVVADGDKLIFADVTVLAGLIADPTGDSIPFNELKDRLLGFGFHILIFDKYYDLNAIWYVYFIHKRIYEVVTPLHI